MRQAVLFVKPSPQVDVATAIATERHRGRLFDVKAFFAGWTTKYSHGLSAVLKQCLEEMIPKVFARLVRFLRVGRLGRALAGRFALRA